MSIFIGVQVLKPVSRAAVVVKIGFFDYNNLDFIQQLWNDDFA